MVFLCYTHKAYNALPQQAESIDYNGVEFTVIKSTILKYLNSTHAHPRFLRSTDAKY